MHGPPPLRTDPGADPSCAGSDPPCDARASSSPCTTGAARPLRFMWRPPVHRRREAGPRPSAQDRPAARPDLGQTCPRLPTPRRLRLLARGGGGGGGLQMRAAGTMPLSLLAMAMFGRTGLEATCHGGWAPLRPGQQRYSPAAHAAAPRPASCILSRNCRLGGRDHRSGSASTHRLRRAARTGSVRRRSADGNRAGTSTAWPEARAPYRSAHDAEMARQRVTLYGTGIEPLANS